MNIQSPSAILRRHNTALRMPARSSFTPGRIPIRLSHLLRFPKHKVGGTLLLFLTGNLELSKSGLQILHIFMRKLPIGFKSSRIIIDCTVYRIGKALFLQVLYEAYHAANFFRCLRMGGSCFDVEIRHIFFHLGNIALRNGLAIYAFFYRSLNDFIVYIRVIRNIFYLIALVLHKTTEGIKYNHRTSISDMNQIVHGRSADIHPDLSFLNRNELFLLLRHGIINLHKNPLFLSPNVLCSLYLHPILVKKGKSCHERFFLS